MTSFTVVRQTIKSKGLMSQSPVGRRRQITRIGRSTGSVTAWVNRRGQRFGSSCTQASNTSKATTRLANSRTIANLELKSCTCLQGVELTGGIQASSAQRDSIRGLGPSRLERHLDVLVEVVVYTEVDLPPNVAVFGLHG